MSGGWPVNGGAPSYQIAHNIFSNEELFADIFDNNVFPEIAEESCGSQGSTSSGSSNEITHTVPSSISEQHGTYLSTSFHQYIGQTHQQLDHTSDLSHTTVLRGTATSSDDYDIHRQSASFDSIYNTTGYSAPRVGGTFRGLAAVDRDLGANTNVSFNQLLYNGSFNPPAQPLNPETQVDICGLDLMDRAAYVTSEHLASLNSTDVSDPSGHGQYECVRQVVREQDATRSQDISAVSTSPLQVPEPSAIAHEQQHTIAKPHSQASQKLTTIEQTSLFQEPDASYNFAVTDKNDIFLDPKLEGNFGKHDPHLAKKVSDAVKALKESGSKPKEQHLHPSPIPGHHQVLWQPPVGDYSIPRTSEHYKICFDLLVKAIDYSGEEVAEKRDTVEFQRRWIKRDYYGQDFVQVLAKQVLDTMIDIHQNGWTYSVQDPVFRYMYHKTMYFTFRDRFNVTALVLKHSKTACNDLMKGQRLYDVIGNSYHLETRVTSNKKANRDRALRLAAEKLTRENVETGAVVPDHAGIKRHNEEDSEWSNDGSMTVMKPNKRNKMNGSVCLSADMPNAASAESPTRLPAEAFSCTAIQTPSVSMQFGPNTTAALSTDCASAETSPRNHTVSNSSFTAHPTKIVVLAAPALKKTQAWPGSAGVYTCDSDPDSVPSSLPKDKSSKRVLPRVSRRREHESGHSAILATKKSKPKARVIAPVEKAAARASITALAKAKLTGVNEDDLYEGDQPCIRGKSASKSVPSSRPRRISTRTHRSVACTSAGSSP